MSDNTQFGVNKIETHTWVPAGRIQRVTAAILVDDAVVRNVVGGKVSYTRQKRSQDELDRIQQLAQAVIGFDAKRGDTISVQDLAFDTPVTAADLPTPNLIERTQKRGNGLLVACASSFAACALPVCLFVRVATCAETGPCSGAG